MRMAGGWENRSKAPSHWGGLGFLPGCVRCIRDREALAWIDRQITLICKYHVGKDFQEDEGRQELV